MRRRPTKRGNRHVLPLLRLLPLVLLLLLILLAAPPPTLAQLDFGPGGPLLEGEPGAGPGGGDVAGGRAGGGVLGAGGAGGRAIVFPSSDSSSPTSSPGQSSFKTLRGSENGAIPFGRYDDDLSGMAGWLSHPVASQKEGGRSLGKWDTAQTDAEVKSAGGGGGRGGGGGGGGGGGAEQAQATGHATEARPFGVAEGNCDCCAALDASIDGGKCGGTIQPDGTCCFIDAPSKYCKAPRACMATDPNFGFGRGGGAGPRTRDADAPNPLGVAKGLDGLLGLGRGGAKHAVDLPGHGRR